MIARGKWGLNRIFLVSTVVCVVFSVFGPYWWFVYSVDGLAYLSAGFALLYFGLTIGKFPLTNKGKLLPRRRFSIGQGAINFCFVLSVLSLCAFAVETVNFIRYYGASFSFLGGAYYEYAAEGRSLFDQVLLSTMQLGTVAYLIVRSSDARLGRFGNALLVLGFWSIGFFALLQGSRFPIAVTFILFFVCERRSGTSLSNTIGRIPFQKKLLVIIMFVLLVFAFAQLMDSKVFVNTPLTQYEIFSGDQGLKPFSYDLYIATNGAVKSLYNICDYIGEAPYVFSGLWQLYPPQDCYPLSSTLRPLAKLLNALGVHVIADPGSIHEASSQIARYSTFQWTLLLEYGKFGGLIASFVYGYVMAKVERWALTSYVCRVLYPCLIPMAIFAPIYFFNVGRLDWIVVESLLVLALLGLFSRGRFVKASEINFDTTGGYGVER